jgi:1,4-alpha-glucan branching enzyme
LATFERKEGVEVAKKKVTKTKATAAKKKPAPAKKPAPVRKKVTFELSAPHAKKVSVVGDFNNWDHSKHPMEKGAGGIWKKTVFLASGTYEYKFLVDDDWWHDPACVKTASNPFGTNNSVLCV